MKFSDKYAAIRAAAAEKMSCEWDAAIMDDFGEYRGSTSLYPRLEEHFAKGMVPGFTFVVSNDGGQNGVYWHASLTDVMDWFMEHRDEHPGYVVVPVPVKLPPTKEELDASLQRSIEWALRTHKGEPSGFIPSQPIYIVKSEFYARSYHEHEHDKFHVEGLLDAVRIMTPKPEGPAVKHIDWELVAVVYPDGRVQTDRLDEILATTDFSKL